MVTPERNASGARSADAAKESSQDDLASLSCQQRTIVLGASNVTLSLPILVETANEIWGGPADFLIAAGFGRSYGRASRVLFRRLGSILSCGLWEASTRRGTLANLRFDHRYRQRYSLWCVGRGNRRLGARMLTAAVPLCDRIVLTGLPWESVSRLDETSFVIFRTLLYPKSTLTLDTAIRHTIELNNALRALSDRYNISWIEPEKQWYGLDPIHIQKKFRRRAWQRIFANEAQIAAATQPLITTTTVSWRRWWDLRWQRQLDREIMGFSQHTPQPSVLLPDGSRVSQF